MKKENIPIRESKIFQLGNGKYFQSELVNWEMAEEEEVDENKRIRPRERARGHKFGFWLVPQPVTTEEQIIQ